MAQSPLAGLKPFVLRPVATPGASLKFHHQAGHPRGLIRNPFVIVAARSLRRIKHWDDSDDSMNPHPTKLAAVRSAAGLSSAGLVHTGCPEPSAKSNGVRQSGPLARR